MVANSVGETNGNGVGAASGDATALVKRTGIAFGEHGLALRSFDDTWRFCTAIARVRYQAKNGEMVPVKGAETAELVMMKVQYGAELGIPAMASVVNVYLVDGRPALGATAIAARIKATGVYSYRIKRGPDGKQMRTVDGVTIEMLVRVGTDDRAARDAYNDKEWAWQGEYSFTKDDAVRADLTGKDNHRRYPRDMFFHRALTTGAREVCPEVFFGSVYTPEELGAIVDDYGDVIEATVVVEPPKTKPRQTRAEQVAAKVAAGAPKSDGGVSQSTLDDVSALEKERAFVRAQFERGEITKEEAARRFPESFGAPLKSDGNDVTGSPITIVTDAIDAAASGAAETPATPPAASGAANPSPSTPTVVAPATAPAAAVSGGESSKAPDLFAAAPPTPTPAAPPPTPPPVAAAVAAPVVAKATAEQIAEFDALFDSCVPMPAKTGPGRMGMVRAAMEESAPADAKAATKMRAKSIGKVGDMTVAEAEAALVVLRAYVAKKRA